MGEKETWARKREATTSGRALPMFFCFFLPTPNSWINFIVITWILYTCHKLRLQEKCCDTRYIYIYNSDHKNRKTHML